MTSIYLGSLSSMFLLGPESVEVRCTRQLDHINIRSFFSSSQFLGPSQPISTHNHLTHSKPYAMPDCNCTYSAFINITLQTCL